MDMSNFLMMLGGLALFLYGMQMMSSSLEAVAGNRLKSILERLTSNRFLGVAVGAGITALVQSSSTTTVMAVGFVNSGLMTLRQAVWIVMGANIGTNITSQLIALDVSSLAPVLAFVGVVMVVFLHKPKTHHLGQIIAGLGVLFIGMHMMSSSMAPLRESPGFVELMTQFSSPLLGILVGAAFTAIIQSSSASVGILQALAVSGLIGLPSAVFVLFGQNIGTCVTALLASISANRNAKRTAIIHLMFNLIGTVIFVGITTLTPFTVFMQSLTPGRPAAQIANIHMVFNVATTLMLLPFGGFLAMLSKKILPDKEDEKNEEQHLAYIDTALLKNERQIGSVAIFIAQLQQEVRRMLIMARENVQQSFLAVKERNVKLLEQIEYTEEYIDYLNKEISTFISHMITVEMSEKDSTTINSYFKITGNIERIGDHAMNISGYASLLERKRLSLSPRALQEVLQ
ncbi:MAG: Na/Pi cotransporter family protein, partial [Acetanaerobacterium sp.]